MPDACGWFGGRELRRVGSLQSVMELATRHLLFSRSINVSTQTAVKIVSQENKQHHSSLSISSLSLLHSPYLHSPAGESGSQARRGPSPAATAPAPAACHRARPCRVQPCRVRPRPLPERMKWTATWIGKRSVKVFVHQKMLAIGATCRF